jgi:ABC-type multidrug transport system fused ATPase/permease subunit
LICLARILIKKNLKILIFDEATSYIDAETNSLILKIIKEKIKNCTILSIVHRLINIADFDKIVYMSEGKIKEIGNPYELLVKDLNS